MLATTLGDKSELSVESVKVSLPGILEKDGQFTDDTACLCVLHCPVEDIKKCVTEFLFPA
jgi:hypothetical protein